MSDYAKLRAIWNRNIHRKGLGIWESTSGSASLVVGATYRVVASGNYPDLVGREGILKCNKPYRHAVDLEIDGTDYEFVAEQLEPV